MFLFLETILHIGVSDDELVFRVLHKNGYYIWYATSGTRLERDNNSFL